MALQNQEVIESLAALPVLPYKHWGSHVLNSRLFEGDKIGMYEQYVRLTGAAPISVEFPQEIQVTKGIEFGRKYGSVLNLYTSPWQACITAGVPSTNRGVPYTTDIANFTARLSTLFRYINTQNLKSATPVLVKAILIDAEEWPLSDPDNTPESVTENHATLITICNAFFPTAKTIFYHRRAIDRDNNTGWSDPDDGFFVGDEYEGTAESGDYSSFTLYGLADLHMMQECIRRNNQLAIDEGFTKIIPWVALGGSSHTKDLTLYQWPQQNSTTGLPKAHTYPVVNSYNMGFMLNYHGFPSASPDRFAPVDKVSEVCFWPAAGSNLVRNWWDHFVAYCQGIPNKVQTVKEPYPEVFYSET